MATKETKEIPVCEVDPAHKAYCESVGLPYCEGCCDQLRTEADGSTLCPIAHPDCPMKQKRGR